MNTIKKYPVMEGKYIVKVNIVKMARNGNEGKSSH